MEQALKDILTLAKDFSGEFGFYAQRVDSNECISWNADEVFDPASVIKLPILAACRNKVLHGDLSLDEVVTLREDDKVPGSGVLKELCPGVSLKLEDLLTLMIIVSDNTATNMVLDRVKPAEVTAYVHQLGLTRTLSARKMFETSIKKTSEISPRDAATLLIMLANHQILTPELCQKAIDILSRQQYVDVLARDLPFDPYGGEDDPNRVRIASKSGFVLGVNHDVGLVMSNRMTYAVALMSKNCADLRFHVDNEAKIFLGKVSRRIYDAFHQAPL